MPAESPIIETFRRGDRMYTLVDLSDRLSNDTVGFEPNPHEIVYVDHRQTPPLYEGALGIPPDYWPDGEMAAVERVTLSSHSGTHVDAPYHYGATSQGHAARTIDRVPLSWCFGDGVLLDFSDRPAGYGITDSDIRAELQRIDHALRPFDIVLIRTDVSRDFNSAGYENRHAGLRRSAVAYLVESGVHLMGIDAWGLDRPFDIMAREAHAGDRDQLWEAHFYGREHEYCHIEKLCHLDQLQQPTGFRVAAFPVKLADASASWTRVVAIYDRPVGGAEA